MKLVSGDDTCEKNFIYISGREFEEFLLTFGHIEIVNAEEVFEKEHDIYEYEIIYDIWLQNFVDNNRLVFRIYSSVVDNVTRDCGKDSIKIIPFDIENEIPLLKKQKRVYRVGTWKDNFNTRIVEIIDALLYIGCIKKIIKSKIVDNNEDVK